MSDSVATTPSFAQLLRNPVQLLAFGFGSGLAPKAPGTFGTLLAVLLFVPLAELDLLYYSAVVIFCAVVGIWICGAASRQLGVHDHGGIVWDEFVGFWITMWAVPEKWHWVILGFLLFRFFDVVKPWPIGWLDKRVGGGFGIMVDDMIAGVMACGVLHVLVRVL
ncbi:MAG: phosphatidylglycerophosphatase A [Halioglobus sp.]